MESKRFVRLERKVIFSDEQRDVIAVIAMVVVAFSGILCWVSSQVSSAL